MRRCHDNQDASLKAQNHAAELKLRAERRLGELLTEMDMHPPGPEPVQSHGVTEPPKLSEMGVSKMQSSRWQLESSVPEARFEDYVTQTNNANDELTSVGLQRFAQSIKEPPSPAETPPMPTGKYGCIVIDTPWLTAFAGEWRKH